MTTALAVRGVDLSHFQSGKLDLGAAKRAGVEFIYHKCTEGEGYVDSFYNQRRAEAAKAGIAFGAYHFARPAVGDAVKEAQFFVHRATPKVGDLLPALDLEDDGRLNPQQLDQWARTFVDEVKRLTKFNSVVYTPFALPSLGHCPLWVARYSNDNTAPVIPKPWPAPTIRQFSNGVYGVPKSVVGIGNVDLNTWGPGAKLSDIRIMEVDKPPASSLSQGKNVDAAVTALKKVKNPKKLPLVKKALDVLSKIKPTR